MPTEPSICIILVNWNQLQLTIDCIESLKAMTYGNFKVVVVDNNSKVDPTDTLTKLSEELIVLRQNENLGFAEGNNVGFRYAFEHQFDFTLALNNDTIVNKDFLWPLVEALAKPNQNLAALSPKIYFKHDPTVIWALGGKVSILKAKGFSYMRKVEDRGQFETDIIPDYLTGCCLLIKTDVLKSLGGFNKDYFAYYEDTDLSFRLKRKGYAIKVITKSCIWHVAGGSSRVSKKKPPFLTYLGTRNRLMFFKTNMHGIKKLYALLFISMETFFAIMFRLITFQFGHLKQEIKGFRDGISYGSSEDTQ